MGVEQTRREAVEEIEQSGHENHDGRRDGHSGGDEKDGQAARNEVAAGDGVGNMLLEAHFCVFSGVQR